MSSHEIELVQMSGSEHLLDMFYLFASAWSSLFVLHNEQLLRILYDPWNLNVESLVKL